MFVGEVVGFKESGYTPHGEFVVAEIEVSDWVLGDESDTVFAALETRMFLDYYKGRLLRTKVINADGTWFKVGDRVVAIAFPGRRFSPHDYLSYVRFFRGSPRDSSQFIYRIKGADFSKVHIPESGSPPELDEIYDQIDRSWEVDEMNLGELVKDLHHFYTERLRWRLTRSIWKRKPWRGNWDPDRGIVP